MSLIETAIDKSIIKAATTGGSIDIAELADTIGIDAETVCEVIELRWLAGGKVTITDGDLRDAQVLTFAAPRFSATAVRQYTLPSKAYEGVQIDDLGDGTDTRQLLSIGRETITRTITHNLEGDGFFSVSIHEQMEVGGVKFLPVLLASETTIPTREAAEEFAENWKCDRIHRQNFHGLIAQVDPGDAESDRCTLYIQREGTSEGTQEGTPYLVEMEHPDEPAAWEFWSDYKFEQFLGKIYTQAPAEPEDPTAEEMAGDTAEDTALHSATVEEPTEVSA